MTMSWIQSNIKPGTANKLKAKRELNVKAQLADGKMATLMSNSTPLMIQRLTVMSLLESQAL